MSDHGRDFDSLMEQLQHIQALVKIPISSIELLAEELTSWRIRLDGQFRIEIGEIPSLEVIKFLEHLIASSTHTNDWRWIEVIIPLVSKLSYATVHTGLFVSLLDVSTVLVVLGVGDIISKARILFRWYNISGTGMLTELEHTLLVSRIAAAFHRLKVVGILDMTNEEARHVAMKARWREVMGKMRFVEALDFDNFLDWFIDNRYQQRLPDLTSFQLSLIIISFPIIYSILSFNVPSPSLFTQLHFPHSLTILSVFMVNSSFVASCLNILRSLVVVIEKLQYKSSTLLDITERQFSYEQHQIFVPPSIAFENCEPVTAVSGAVLVVFRDSCGVSFAIPPEALERDGLVVYALIEQLIPMTPAPIPPAHFQEEHHLLESQRGSVFHSNVGSVVGDSSVLHESSSSVIGDHNMSAVGSHVGDDSYQINSREQQLNETKYYRLKSSRTCLLNNGKILSNTPCCIPCNTPPPPSPRPSPLLSSPLPSHPPPSLFTPLSPLLPSPPLIPLGDGTMVSTALYRVDIDGLDPHSKYCFTFYTHSRILTPIEVDTLPGPFLGPTLVPGPTLGPGVSPVPGASLGPDAASIPVPGHGFGPDPDGASIPVPGHGVGPDPDGVSGGEGTEGGYTSCILPCSFPAHSIPTLLNTLSKPVDTIVYSNSLCSIQQLLNSSLIYLSNSWRGSPEEQSNAFASAVDAQYGVEWREALKELMECCGMESGALELSQHLGTYPIPVPIPTPAPTLPYPKPAITPIPALTLPCFTPNSTLFYPCFTRTPLPQTILSYPILHLTPTLSTTPL